jgi:hypothetical protein
MATYLNDLRLTELATGEGSGTWGTTTNLSLELIGEALGFATQQVFGSDADATTTIADGASDPARAMYFKITSAGSLTATRTCTIAPNTISRVMFIENATTGSQSIQISQGSGASVTILAGKTAVVYLDGAGATAAVVDAMAGVDPGVTDTLAEVLASGNTSGANNLIIDNGQAITTNTINETTAASGVTIDSVLLKDDGVNATNLEITNLKANDGTSAGSIANSTGIVTLASSVLTTADINGGTIDGTTLGATTPASVAATTLSTTGDISLPDGAKAIFGAGSDLQIYHDGSNSYVKDNGVGDLIIQAYDDIKFQQSTDNADLVTINTGGNVGIGTSTPVTLKSATTLQVSGNAKLGDDNGRGLLSLGDIASTGANAGIWRGAAGAYAGTGNYLNLGGYDGITFTTGAADISAQTERMRIDASGNVGIGTASVAYKLDVNGSLSSNGSENVMRIAAADSTQAGGVNIHSIYGASASSRVTTFFSIDGQGQASPLAFGNGTTEAMRIDSSGNVGIGTSSPSSIANYVVVETQGDTTTTGGIYYTSSSDSSQKAHFYVGGGVGYLGTQTNHPLAFTTNNAERMRIDASGNVGIGTSSPSADLQINDGNTTRGVAGTFHMYGSAVNGDAGDVSNEIFFRDESVSGWGGAFIRTVRSEDDQNGKDALTFGTSTYGGSAVERVRIDDSGNVGIGTSSPAEKLDISQSVNNSVITKVTNTNSGDLATARVEIHNNDSSFGQLTTYSSGFGYPVLGSSAANWTFIGSSGANSNGLKIGTLTADPIVFGTNDTERMRLDASGNLGIGTDSPSLENGSGLVVYNATAPRISLKNSTTGTTGLDGVDIAMVSSDAYFFNREAGAVILGTSSFERMRIDASGNVGIGTSSPAVQLDIVGSSAAVQVSESGGATARIAAGGASAFLGTYSNHPLLFLIDSNEKMRIDASGNLLVGTTSVSGKVTIANGGADGIYVDGTGTGYVYRTSNTTGLAGYFVTSSGAAGSISVSGTTTAYNTSSDQRLKENIADADDAGSKIDAIQVRKFDWKADGSHQDYGMVAQELMTVAPEAVHQPEDPDQMMGVDYSKLVPMMLKEIQSLRARLEALEGAN